ncbi:hypothetical protein Bca101_098579 [Brassica carinata]
MKKRFFTIHNFIRVLNRGSFYATRGTTCCLHAIVAVSADSSSLRCSSAVTLLPNQSSLNLEPLFPESPASTTLSFVKFLQIDYITGGYKPKI